jgi:hypothetical protein
MPLCLRPSAGEIRSAEGVASSRLRQARQETLQVLLSDEHTAAELASDKLAGPDCAVDRVPADPRLGADFRDRKGGPTGRVVECRGHEGGIPIKTVTNDSVRGMLLIALAVLSRKYPEVPDSGDPMSARPHKATVTHSTGLPA